MYLSLASNFIELFYSQVDENRDGVLSCFETLIALKGITETQNLTEQEEEYVCRVSIILYDFRKNHTDALFEPGMLSGPLQKKNKQLKKTRRKNAP